MSKFGDLFPTVVIATICGVEQDMDDRKTQLYRPTLSYIVMWTFDVHSRNSLLSSFRIFVGVGCSWLVRVFAVHTWLWYVLVSDSRRRLRLAERGNVVLPLVDWIHNWMCNRRLVTCYRRLPHNRCHHPQPVLSGITKDIFFTRNV